MTELLHVSGAYWPSTSALRSRCLPS